MSIKILTYNTALLSVNDFKNENDEQRVVRSKNIANAILENNYDIVCLQEVFMEPARKEIVKKFKDIYPHIIKKSGNSLLPPEDSGLFFASKYKIDGWNFDFFKPNEETANWDASAEKGVLFSLLNMGDEYPNHSLLVATTHLQADYENYKYSWIRLKQIEVIRNGLFNILVPRKDVNDEKKLSCILLGDLNVKGTPLPDNESGEYWDIMNGLRYPRDLFAEKHEGEIGWTFNSEENEFLKRERPNEKEQERLDFALAYDLIPSKTGKSPTLDKINCLNVEIVKFKNADGIDLSDHYGLSVEFEL